MLLNPSCCTSRINDRLKTGKYIYKTVIDSYQVPHNICSGRERVFTQWTETWKQAQVCESKCFDQLTQYFLFTCYLCSAFTLIFDSHKTINKKPIFRRHHSSWIVSAYVIVGHAHSATVLSPSNRRRCPWAHQHHAPRVYASTHQRHHTHTPPFLNSMYLNLVLTL